MKTLYVKRVMYGKDSTPIELREYRPVAGGPVGNREDWKEFASKHNYGEILFMDKQGIKESMFNLKGRSK